MTTRGVELDNVADWFGAGAVAVGVGATRLDSKAISTGHYGVLTARASVFRAAVKQARAA